MIAPLRIRIPENKCLVQLSIQNSKLRSKLETRVSTYNNNLKKHKSKRDSSAKDVQQEFEWRAITG